MNTKVCKVLQDVRGWQWYCHDIFPFVLDGIEWGCLDEQTLFPYGSNWTWDGHLRLIRNPDIYDFWTQLKSENNNKHSVSVSFSFAEFFSCCCDQYFEFEEKQKATQKMLRYPISDPWGHLVSWKCHGKPHHRSWQENLLADLARFQIASFGSKSNSRHRCK